MSGQHACHLQRFLYKQKKHNIVKMIKKKAMLNTGIWFVYTPTLQGPQNGVCSQKRKEECKWDLKRFLKKNAYCLLSTNFDSLGKVPGSYLNQSRTRNLYKVVYEDHDFTHILVVYGDRR